MIAGPGSGLLTVRESASVTTTINGIIIGGAAGTTVDVSGLTVSGMRSSGISISGAATITFNDVSVTGNSATFSGGGINVVGAAPGSLTIQDSTIATNSCGFSGGGINKSGGASLLVVNCVISGNTGGFVGGGGIYTSGTGAATIATPRSPATRQARPGAAARAAESVLKAQAA
jgi:predicted outer membrane repeat protein